MAKREVGRETDGVIEKRGKSIYRKKMNNKMLTFLNPSRYDLFFGSFFNERYSHFLKQLGTLKITKSFSAIFSCVLKCI